MKKQYGTTAEIPEVEQLRVRYGLDKPQWYRYGNGSRVAFGAISGESFGYNKEVSELIWDRVALTVLISTCSMVMIYLIAIPLGIFSATPPIQGRGQLPHVCRIRGDVIAGFSRGAGAVGVLLPRVFTFHCTT